MGAAHTIGADPRSRRKHYITQRFIKTKWTPSAYALGDTIAFTSTFRGTVPEAQGILDAAIAEDRTCVPIG
jgi:hypothetical protein